MNSNEDQRLKSLLQWMLFTVLLSASLLSIFHTKTRQSLKGLFSFNERTILSVVIGDVLGDGRAAKIIKIKTPGALLLEVYDAPKEGIRKLLHTLKIQDPHDGFFHLNGAATNLALVDIDNDNIVEIVAPSFDANLVAHLNVYKYDHQVRSFIPFSPMNRVEN